ncbi:MAG: hypothetical protein E7092_07730 [Bacteroidales bacterium]|nr:hypothetical protein [Bacteroidales bacterium]
MAIIREVVEVIIKINDEEAKKQLPALQKKVEDFGRFDSTLAVIMPRCILQRRCAWRVEV